MVDTKSPVYKFSLQQLSLTYMAESIFLALSHPRIDCVQISRTYHKSLYK